MGKAVPCEIVFNTKNGHIMKPISCRSMAEAMELARQFGMAYRIFVNGKCKKSGWIQK